MTDGVDHGEMNSKSINEWQGVLLKLRSQLLGQKQTHVPHVLVGWSTQRVRLFQTAIALTSSRACRRCPSVCSAPSVFSLSPSW
jgi:hypothetical protein